MEEVTVETLAVQLWALAAEVRTLRFDFQARLNATVGPCVVRKAITVLQRDLDTLTAAVNDMARINMTAGEADRLHTELERIAAK